MNHQQVEKEVFLSINGPNPTNAENLIERALNLRFNGNTWHFHHFSRHSSGITSRVVDRLLKEADNKDIDLWP